MNTKAFALALTGCLLLGVAACEQKGPAEKLGENIDDATAEFRDGVEDACEDLKEGLGAKDSDCD